ncbi:MAG: hypothetical protein JW809_01520 [Pirellulales bacterium]|nr:hypothetical protein [Pirellulales bacterium]
MKRNDRLSILALVCLSAAVQVVVIGQRPVPSLDAIRFVGIAQSIDDHGLAATVRAHREQPLFPAWLWTVHAGLAAAGVVRSVAGWATAAQVAAAAPLMLAVVPVTLLARRLAGRRAALAGAALFCVLPEMARLGAEGLSDGLHLLLAATALWVVVEAFSRRHLRAPGTCALFGLAGATVGLAALARAEVLVLPGVVVVTLVVVCRGGAAISRDRGPLTPDPSPASGRGEFVPCLSRVLVPAGSLALGLAAVLAPFAVLTKTVTPLAALARVAGRAGPTELPWGTGISPEPRSVEGDSRRRTNPADAPSATGVASHSLAFAVREPGSNTRRRGLAAGVMRFGEKLADAFGYGVGLLAAAGFWKRRRAGRPTDRFARIFFAIFSLAVIAFASAEGYLSARHLALLVVVGTGAIGSGALWLGQRTGAWMGTVPFSLARKSGRSPGAGWSWSVVVLAMVLCAAVTLQPSHEARRAYREAGQWIAGQPDSVGVVLDTRGWTALYSSRATYQHDRAEEAFSDARLAYVVVREDELSRSSPRGRALRRLLDRAAQRVATFPSVSGVPSDDPALVVFRWRDERLHAAQNAGPVAEREVSR